MGLNQGLPDYESGALTNWAMGPALLQSECKVKRNISKLQILRGVFAFFCVFNKKIARQHNACKQLLSGWEDSNFRPPRPERGALTNCATPRVGKPIAKLHQFFEIATIFCNFYFLIGDLFVELVFWDEGLLDAHGSAIMPAIFLLKRRCGFWRRFFTLNLEILGKKFERSMLNTYSWLVCRRAIIYFLSWKYTIQPNNTLYILADAVCICLWEHIFITLYYRQ